jgi:hypothetical protein
MKNLNNIDVITNIKFKLTLYNKVNYCQLLLIKDINSSIINIINNYNTKNTKKSDIILFSSFYKNILETNTQKNIINAYNSINYENILNKYNIKGNIVFLSNFNNIFSKKWTKIELLKLFKTYKNLLFIIDETYINESDDSIYSCSNCMNLFHNILIIKTLTNVFDTNIKYIVSNVELINKISI